jgi:hypothetical protein
MRNILCEQIIERMGSINKDAQIILMKKSVKIWRMKSSHITKPGEETYE